MMMTSSLDIDKCKETIMEQQKLKRFYTGVVWTFVKLGYEYRNLVMNKLSWAKAIYKAAANAREQEMMANELARIFDDKSKKYVKPSPPATKFPKTTKIYETNIRQYKAMKAAKPSKKKAKK